MGALAGLAVISSVRAEEDMTAKIKAACQKSDKTYWVESTGACIPKNPCKDNVYKEAYCSNIFKDIELTGKNEYMFLVDLDRTLRGLDCEVQPTKSKSSGQDYVPCVGRDVMVYEFDDIHDVTVQSDEFGMFRKAVCRVFTENGISYGSEISLELCKKIEDMSVRFRNGNATGLGFDYVATINADGEIVKTICRSLCK